MKKRILSLLLVVLMLISMVPSSLTTAFAEIISAEPISADEIDIEIPLAVAGYSAQTDVSEVKTSLKYNGATVSKSKYEVSELYWVDTETNNIVDSFTSGKTYSAFICLKTTSSNDYWYDVAGWENTFINGASGVAYHDYKEELYVVCSDIQPIELDIRDHESGNYYHLNGDKVPLEDEEYEFILPFTNNEILLTFNFPDSVKADGYRLRVEYTEYYYKKNSNTPYTTYTKTFEHNDLSELGNGLYQARIDGTGDTEERSVRFVADVYIVAPDGLGTDTYLESYTAGLQVNEFYYDDLYLRGITNGTGDITYKYFSGYTEGREEPVVVKHDPYFYEEFGFIWRSLNNCYLNSAGGSNPANSGSFSLKPRVYVDGEQVEITDTIRDVHESTIAHTTIIDEKLIGEPGEKKEIRVEIYGDYGSSLSDEGFRETDVIEEFFFEVQFGETVQYEHSIPVEIYVDGTEVNYYNGTAFKKAAVQAYVPHEVEYRIEWPTGSYYVDDLFEIRAFIHQDQAIESSEAVSHSLKGDGYTEFIPSSDNYIEDGIYGAAVTVYSSEGVTDASVSMEMWLCEKSTHTPISMIRSDEVLLSFTDDDDIFGIKLDEYGEIKTQTFYSAEVDRWNGYDSTEYSTENQYNGTVDTLVTDCFFSPELDFIYYFTDALREVQASERYDYVPVLYYRAGSSGQWSYFGEYEELRPLYNSQSSTAIGYRVTYKLPAAESATHYEFRLQLQLKTPEGTLISKYVPYMYYVNVNYGTEGYGVTNGIIINGQSYAGNSPTVSFKPTDQVYQLDCKYYLDESVYNEGYRVMVEEKLGGSSEFIAADDGYGNCTYSFDTDKIDSSGETVSPEIVMYLYKGTFNVATAVRVGSYNPTVSFDMPTADLYGNIIGIIDGASVSVKLYKDGSLAPVAQLDADTVYRISALEHGTYTIVASAEGYEDFSKTVSLNGDMAVNINMAYIIDDSVLDFEAQYPDVSIQDAQDGITELGLVNTAPTFSFAVKALPEALTNAGYTVSASTVINHGSGDYEGSADDYYWSCPINSFGTKTVTQTITLLDPNGEEVASKTHSYNFTYIKLQFYTRTPSVTTGQAAMGMSVMGTLTTAQSFSFEAAPLNSELTAEGYSIKCKTEAYQGDILVYSVENGNTYTHIYDGDGRVIHTIILLDEYGDEVGSISHTYSFTMDFPDGTVTLSSSFLTVEEGASAAITATVTPQSLANTLSWSIDNEDIAAIDENGNVEGIRAGSAIITATLGNGIAAYCPVMVTDSDVLAYVGGVGLALEEYLEAGSSIPTQTQPSDSYAYLTGEEGNLSLYLYNYDYSGTGTFATGRATYAIYSENDIRVISMGENTLGPLYAPLERYTSYGIGDGQSIAVDSEGDYDLNITGVTTAVKSSQYLFVYGNLNITNVTGAYSGSSLYSRISFITGNVNIQCSGTAISSAGGNIEFNGSNVNIVAGTGLSCMRTASYSFTAGTVTINSDSTGIKLKSGDSLTVDGGTLAINSKGDGIDFEGDMTVEDGSVVIRSSNTESDADYCALNGGGYLSTESGIYVKASTEPGGEVGTYTEANRDSYDLIAMGYYYMGAVVGGSISGMETAEQVYIYLYEEGYSEPSYEATTNGNGAYSFTDVYEGSYTVTAIAEGYKTYTAQLTVDSIYTLHDIEMDKEGGSVSGTVTSFRSNTDPVTIQLYEEGLSEPAYEVIVYGNSASYMIEDVLAGTYTVKVMKKNHATREYTVTVSGEAVTLDAKIHLLGDINGDGRLNSRDSSILKSFVKNERTPDEYEKACVDVNGDGRVNARDTALIKAHILNTRSLWS